MLRALILVSTLALAACSAPGDAVAVGARTSAPGVVADSLVRNLPDELYSATVRYPQLVNAGSATAAINASLRADAERLLGEFPPARADDIRDALEQGMTSIATVELSAQYEVERLDAGVFSVNRMIYAYTGGAHGNYWFQPANVDLRRGRRIALGDLFAPGTAYLEAVSGAARRSLEAQGWDGSDALWAEGLDPVEDNFDAFTLAADSLVFHFAPYQVGPWSDGAHRAAVAYADLAGTLADDAPVGR